MYQFKNECNHENFFWWSKRLIENKNWALLPTSSKAVWPVIACFCDQKGVAFPGEQTIGPLAGRSDKQVRAGIKGLESFPDFKMTYYTTKRGRRSKKFYLRLPSRNASGRSFPFYKFLLDSGAWRELKPTAQALYPVMRFFSYFNIDTYNEIEDQEAMPNEFDEVYTNRCYDFCYADKYLMAELANINIRSLSSALNSLTENYLIEQINNKSWKVFLQTKDSMTWKREYLNEKLLKSYRHELQK